MRLRPRSLILASLAGCLAAAAAMLAWPGVVAVAWAGTAAFGFFVGPLVANIFALAGEIMPVTGQVTGVFVVGISLGGLVIPWLIGQLIEPAGPGVAAGGPVGGRGPGRRLCFSALPAARARAPGSR